MVWEWAAHLGAPSERQKEPRKDHGPRPKAQPRTSCLWETVAKKTAHLSLSSLSTEGQFMYVIFTLLKTDYRAISSRLWKKQPRTSFCWLWEMLRRQGQKETEAESTVPPSPVEASFYMFFLTAVIQSRALQGKTPREPRTRRVRHGEHLDV